MNFRLKKIFLKITSVIFNTREKFYFNFLWFKKSFISIINDKKFFFLITEKKFFFQFLEIHTFSEIFFILINSRSWNSVGMNYFIPSDIYVSLKMNFFQPQRKFIKIFFQILRIFKYSEHLKISFFSIYHFDGNPIILKYSKNKLNSKKIIF